MLLYIMVAQEPGASLKAGTWDTNPDQTLVWWSILLGIEKGYLTRSLSVYDQGLILHVSDLVEAWVKATTDEVMKEKAIALAERIGSAPI